MIRHPFKVKPPDYDPERQLLAAVVLEAVRDCCFERTISRRDRESARAFLSGEEGSAWLRAFGISAEKVRAFIENGYEIVGKGA